MRAWKPRARSASGLEFGSRSGSGFLVFLGSSCFFFIFRAEADTCWSARFARSRVGGVERLFKEISVFFRILVLFQFSVIFRILVASENEQVVS